MKTFNTKILEVVDRQFEIHTRSKVLKLIAKSHNEKEVWCEALKYIVMSNKGIDPSKLISKGSFINKAEPNIELVSKRP